MARRLRSAEAGFEAAFAALLAEKREGPGDHAAKVAAIIAAVRARGDAALLDYTARFDGLELEAAQLRLGPQEIAAAAAACPPATRAALKEVADGAGVSPAAGVSPVGVTPSSSSSSSQAAKASAATAMRANKIHRKRELLP